MEECNKNQTKSGKTTTLQINEEIEDIHVLCGLFCEHGFECNASLIMTIKSSHLV